MNFFDRLSCKYLSIEYIERKKKRLLAHATSAHSIQKKKHTKHTVKQRKNEKKELKTKQFVKNIYLSQKK